VRNELFKDTNISGGYTTTKFLNFQFFSSLVVIPMLTAPYLLHTGEDRVYLGHWETVYEAVLQYQRIWLSSHVLYGSSRLGTKDLPR
jgi:hypothetical protein